MKDFGKVALLILLDQATKLLVNSNFQVGGGFDIIPKVLSITYVRNTGAAWNSFTGQTLVLVGIPLLALVAGTIYLIKHRRDCPKVLKIAICMVMAGGAGNLIDRVFVGYVTDMINFHIWPVFNVADILIVVGAILLCIYVLFLDNKDKKS